MFILIAMFCRTDCSARMLFSTVLQLSSIKELWSDVLALYGQNQAKSRLDKEQQKLTQASF